MHERRTTDPSDVLTAALAAWDAGCSVLPAREDGTKVPRSLSVPASCEAPACIGARAKASEQRRPARGWKHYSHARLERVEVERLFAEAEGLCVVCGAVSGGLKALEGDTPEIADEFRAAVVAAGHGDLIDRLDAGYLELSPKGGTHWLFRVPGDTHGNRKLARRPKLPEEMTDPEDKVQVLLETREEGGQIVVAPSGHRVHPSGKPYVLLAGGFATLPTLTADEWSTLMVVAATFDTMPEQELRGRVDRSPRPVSTGGSETIMEWFNASAAWCEILEPHGWSFVGDQGDNQVWCRPGKQGAISATINSSGDGVLYVFSSSTPFIPERAYSKFAAYAVLRTGGDMSEAGRVLRAWRNSR